MPDTPETTDDSDIGPDIGMDAAWRALADGDMNKARLLLEQLPEQSANESEAKRIAARLAWLEGFPEPAMVILTEAAQTHPDDYRLLTDLAQLQLDAGQSETALQTLDEVTALKPDLPEAKIARYAALSALGRKDEAHEALKTTLDELLADGKSRPDWNPMFPSDMFRETDS